MFGLSKRFYEISTIYCFFGALQKSHYALESNRPQRFTIMIYVDRFLGLFLCYMLCLYRGVFGVETSEIFSAWHFINQF